MKNTFAAKTFAAKTFACGAWRGVKVFVPPTITPPSGRGGASGGGHAYPGSRNRLDDERLLHELRHRKKPKPLAEAPDEPLEWDDGELPKPRPEPVEYAITAVLEFSVELSATVEYVAARRPVDYTMMADMTFELPTLTGRVVFVDRAKVKRQERELVSALMAHEILGY